MLERDVILSDPSQLNIHDAVQPKFAAQSLSSYDSPSGPHGEAIPLRALGDTPSSPTLMPVKA